MSSTIPNGLTKSLVAGAVILLGAQQVAEAVTFGRLRVQSALGQPLSVEVDISGVTPEEARSLVVRLAPSDAYRQAGVQYGSQAAAARLTLEPKGTGSYVARISSAQPVDEPFIDLVVDAAWATGKVSRVYTILLDPAESPTRKRPEEPPIPLIPAKVTDNVPVPLAPAAPVALPAPSAPPVAPVAESPRKGADGLPETTFLRPEQSGRPDAAPADRRRVVAESGADSGAYARREASGAPGGTYRVQRGDTLSGIAGQFADGGEVTLEQMLVAMYRSNTRAFIGGDPNRLRDGVILRVPSAAQGRKLPRRAARREMVALTTNFAAYRDRLATAALATPAVGGGNQSDTGKAEARVNEKAAAEAPADRLKLSKGGDAGAKIAEGSVAAERAIQDAQAKVSQLEDTVKDLTRLKDLKQAASGAVASAPVEESKVAVAGGTDAAPASAGAVASDASAASSGLVAAASGVLAGAASGILSGSVESSGGVVPAPVAPPPAEKGFLESLVDNPILLPAAGALVALLVGLGLYRRRRSSALKADGDGVLMFGADAADLKIDADAEPPKPAVKPVQPSAAPVQPPAPVSTAPVSTAPTDGFVITSGNEPDDADAKTKPVPASLRREVPAPVLVSKPAAPAPAPMSAAAEDRLRASTTTLMASAFEAPSQSQSATPTLIGRDAELRAQIELANAYLDIGDAEGARGLLQKVIDESSGEIREQAVKLLGEIR